MTPEMVSKLRRSLIKHEGYKTHPYFDTATSPKITIGIGYNLSDRGIGEEWINQQYQLDVNFFLNKLSGFEWFEFLNLDRQIVLVDMLFNLGWKRFLEFEKMIGYLAVKDHKNASLEMINSKWGEQNKERALELAHAMDTGIYEI